MAELRDYQQGEGKDWNVKGSIAYGKGQVHLAGPLAVRPRPSDQRTRPRAPAYAEAEEWTSVKPATMCRRSSRKRAKC